MSGFDPKRTFRGSLFVVAARWPKWHCLFPALWISFGPVRREVGMPVKCHHRNAFRGSGSRLLQKRLFTLLTAAAMLPVGARAETPAWSTMAEADLAAAYDLLTKTHPGAVTETGDTAFLHALAAGREEASKLAAQARNFGSYRAALQRFAAEFDDAHISTSSNLPLPQRWPGFIVADRGKAWEVIARADQTAPPVGSRLVSCDGETPLQLAERRLAPFIADWSVRTQRLRASTGLLLNSDNPVHPALTSCTFTGSAGEAIQHRLTWRSLGQGEWGKQMAGVMPMAPEDLYVRPFDKGHWVRLGTLSGKAYPLIQQIEAQQSAIRAAPYVVVDLRSNGGGASAVTDKLARVIYGAGAVHRAQLEGASGGNDMVWRASPGALEYAEGTLKRVAGLGTPDDPGVLGLQAQRDALAKALAAGTPMARGPIDLHVSGRPPRDVVKKPPRVIVITDRYCFSSCLTGVHLFRELGAVHVGEETNANTHYSNMVTVELPSGLSTFSTLQAYMAALPRQLGPFAPAVPLPINLADDEALQQSVRQLLARK